MKQGLITEPAMGEVRVEVKLTNFLDWEQAQDGKLQPDGVRTVIANALVDTGVDDVNQGHREQPNGGPQDSIGFDALHGRYL